MTPPPYLPALITPFTRSGELDVKAHVFNVGLLSDAGIEGFVIGGSNGEGPYLERGERERLVKSVRQRKTHLMVGIMAETVRMAIGQIEESATAGADAVLVLTPTTLARGLDDTVIRFYRAVADQAEVPVFLYSVPGVTAYSIPVEVVSRLSRHSNIVGIKDSSGDVVRIQSLINATPKGFVVYSGSSHALLAALAVGCHGAITGSGNYAWALVRQIMDSSDPEKGRRLQKKLAATARAIEAHGIPGVKAAAEAAGLRPGYPRLPLAPVSHGTQTAIANLI